MKDIEFSCKYCGTHLKATFDLAGADLECPSCGKPIIVPERCPTKPRLIITPERSEKARLDAILGVILLSFAAGASVFYRASVRLSDCIVTASTFLADSESTYKWTNDPGLRDPFVGLPIALTAILGVYFLFRSRVSVLMGKRRNVTRGEH